MRTDRDEAYEGYIGHEDEPGFAGERARQPKAQPRSSRGPWRRWQSHRSTARNTLPRPGTHLSPMRPSGLNTHAWIMERERVHSAAEKSDIS